MNRMASFFTRGLSRTLASSSRPSLAPGPLKSACCHRMPGGPPGGSKESASASRSAFSSPFSNKWGAIPGTGSHASRIARLPGELAVVTSLIPYHSATAESRLVTRLGTGGDSGTLQGTLMHTPPEL